MMTMMTKQNHKNVCLVCRVLHIICLPAIFSLSSYLHLHHPRAERKQAS